MALTVTVAGASSDSYATEAEADAYLVIKQSATWTAASTALKEAALKTATALMDELAYKKASSSTSQALRFPLTINFVSGSYVIPDRVKRAQSYLALMLLESPSAFAGVDNVSSVKVDGSWAINYDTSQEGAGFELPEEVHTLLNRYFWKSGASGGPRVWSAAARSWI